MTNNVRLSAVHTLIRARKSAVHCSTHIRGGHRGPRCIFHTLMSNRIRRRNSGIGTHLCSTSGGLNISIKLTTVLRPGNIGISLVSARPVLNCGRFMTGSSGCIVLDSSKHMSTSLILGTTTNGVNVHICSGSGGRSTLRSVAIDVDEFGLSGILDIVPCVPSVANVVSNSFRFVRAGRRLSISSGLGVSGVACRGYPVNGINSRFACVPGDSKSRCMSTVLACRNSRITAIANACGSRNTNSLSTRMKLRGLPLRFVGNFMPSRLVNLGKCNRNTLGVGNTLDGLSVSNRMCLSSTCLMDIPCNVSVQFTGSPIHVASDGLLFRGFVVCTGGRDPLGVRNTLSFASIRGVGLGVQVETRSFLLVSTRRGTHSRTFNGTCIGFFKDVRNSLSGLGVVNGLSMLNGAGVACVLHRSRLAASGRLRRLIGFAGFGDNGRIIIRGPALSNFSVLLDVSVSRSTHVLYTLGTSGAGCISLVKKNGLRVQCGATSNVELANQCALGSNRVGCSLPVVPLGAFSVRSKDCVRFANSPFGPALGVATARSVGAAIGRNRNDKHSISFVYNIGLDRALRGPNVRFVVSTSGSRAVRSRLGSVDMRRQNGVTVAVLTSNVCLTDKAADSFSVGATLASFLGSRVGGVTNATVQDVKLSINVSISGRAGTSNKARASCGFGFTGQFFGGHLDFSINKRISANTRLRGTGGGRSFFGGIRIRCHLGRKTDVCIETFCGTGACS